MMSGTVNKITDKTQSDLPLLLLSSRVRDEMSEVIEPSSQSNIPVRAGHQSRLLFVITSDWSRIRIVRLKDAESRAHHAQFPLIGAVNKVLNNNDRNLGLDPMEILII